MGFELFWGLVRVKVAFSIPTDILKTVPDGYFIVVLSILSWWRSRLYLCS